MYAAWLEGNVEKGIDGTLNLHESLVALKMVQRIDGSIIWFQPRHAEPKRNLFLQNSTSKRGMGTKAGLLATSTMEIIKPVI